MSIILKGVDLPNSGQIELIIRPHGKVLSNTRGIYTEAIQIPKGHGRLIDGDKLFYEEVGKIKPRNDEHYKAIGEFMNMITNAPTILEAEETDEFDT